MIRKAEYYRASGKTGQKKWRAYVLSLVIILVAGLLLQLVFRKLLFYPMKVSSDSMAPEIQSGDKRYFIHPKLTTVVLGDIVLVRPNSAEADFLCRVAAVDGDKVKIAAGQFFVNGQVKKIFEPRLQIPEDRSFYMPEIEVRPNYFFCLNENFRNSRDSRTAGIFERGQITAKVFRPTLFF